MAKAPRRKKPTFTPLQMAILTGGPLPDELSRFYIYNLEHPDNPGLINTDPYDMPFAAVWKQHHGRTMTDEDRAYLTKRVTEIHARQSMAISVRHVNAQTPNASNWPKDQTDGFKSIARKEIDNDD